jgi:hypothetical protein
LTVGFGQFLHAPLFSNLKVQLQKQLLDPVAGIESKLTKIDSLYQGPLVCFFRKGSKNFRDVLVLATGVGRRCRKPVALATGVSGQCACISNETTQTGNPPV